MKPPRGGSARARLGTGGEVVACIDSDALDEITPFDLQGR
jgi:hypothetical protein